MNLRTPRKSLTVERRITLVVVALLSASVLMFSLFLSSGNGRDGLVIYLSVIAAIVILWLASIMINRKNDRL